ncbi:MAG: T9SS type A sorting domain-containing protein [Bacteroidota bacterium]
MRLFCFFLLFTFISGSTGAQPDWATDVAPILYDKCTSCHRPGGIGPFSLMSFQDAFDNAASIEHAVSTGKMPPWLPDTTYQRFVHERTISAQQISTIQQWVSAGMPSGNLVDAPNPPVYSNVSRLDTVSLSLRIPTFTVNSNNDVYRNFVLPSGLVQAAFANGIEIVPGNSAIVHHVLVFQDSTNNTINPNSTGGTGSAASQLIFGYTPGASPVYTPAGTGYRLPANTRIILQMHFAPGSLGQVDSTRINIKLTTGNLRNITVNSLLFHNSPSLVNGPLHIPANTVRTFEERFQVLTGNYTMLYVFPHMHLIGRSIHSYALKPVTNDTIPFVRINDWEFHWQDNFIFRNPIKIPNLSNFRAFATYDNTVNNPHNPSDPPVDVSLGESTLDEMMLVFFAYMPYQTGDENLIVDKRINASGNTNICAGQTVYLRVLQGNGYSYQWYLNGNPINGATAFEYAATQAGSYTVNITSPTQNVFSNAKVVNVSTPSVATISPAGFNLANVNDSLLLTAGTGNGFTYQWYQDGIAIPGSTSDTYMATSEGDYTVIINNGGCFSESPIATLSYLNTGVQLPDEEGVRIFPNPTQGPTSVRISTAAVLIVHDLKGRLVLERQLLPGSTEIRLEAAGTYLFEFTDSNGKVTQRRVTVEN